MAFELPTLPYSTDALMPQMSAETLHYHYGKHHKAYVDTLNKLVSGTEFATMSLEDVVRKSSGAMFNNAAQNWNHTFFWKCLQPNGGGEPTGALAEAIQADFGSLKAFKEKFTDVAVKTFGSGWTWLVKNKTSGKLECLSTANAGCPLTEGHTPLLALDVWEHAYYLDHRNDRAKFVETFWQIANWKFASANLR